MTIMMSRSSEFLQTAYETLRYIDKYCQVHLSDNALVIKSMEPCKFIVPENNHLQDSQDKEEEHQEGEVDKEWHNAALSSDESHNAETNDNLSTETLCLDTHMESINNDELEIEP